METKYLCYYVATNGQYCYVSHLPGDGGVDWGYVFHSAGARLLTLNQARRWWNYTRATNNRTATMSPTSIELREHRMTPAELKAKVEATGSNFFDRKTMRFFGDTMRNYKVSGPTTIETYSGMTSVYVVERRKPNKTGLQDNAYFDAETFERRHKKQ